MVTGIRNIKVGPIRSDAGGAIKERRCSGPISGPGSPRLLPAKVVTAPDGNYDLPDGIVTGIRNIKVGPIRSDGRGAIEERRRARIIRRPLKTLPYLQRS